jgi:hypothetical protein
MSRPICPFLAKDILEMDISEIGSHDILFFPHTSHFSRPPHLCLPTKNLYFIPKNHEILKLLKRFQNHILEKH